MAARRTKESLLSDTQFVFPVSVHASGEGNSEPIVPEDGVNTRRKEGYSLREDRKRSFAEFDCTDSDQPEYPYSDEDGATPAPRPARSVPSLLDFCGPADDRSSSKVRVRNWTHPETKSLLAIWSDPEVQAELKSSIHNSWIWERISVLIGQRHPEFQPPRTAAQCKERLTYLRKQYRKSARLRARGKWPNVGNIKIYLDELHSVLGKRSPGKSKSTAPSTASSFRARATNSASQPPTTPSAVKAALAARPQAAETPELLLPEVPESDYDENEDDDEEDGTEDLEETDGNDMQDFFGRNQSQEAEDDLPAEMPSNHDKITEPGHSSYNPTAATNLAKTSKRPASSRRNPGQPRGRPKAPSGPPRDDLTVAQAITDSVQRFIDHQSHHLTEQHKLLQRYLKFERARMRWEMDMETRRMKWEEEREMREEERRQRQEELEAKRVSDNREFMLQMAVVLGNGESGAGKDSNSSKN
ncbi:uncharacterized protein LOC110982232 [Acanthaster planci]|uniref:Uncharacterized protein LOC110982232 n=1 Tax=Acanthaster planci TaxID=133434 RepID=A0A8B7YUP4_ACAPL|nr:uncharacterized protein LOC110982232 [Acanthaster planci]